MFMLRRRKRKNDSLRKKKLVLVFKNGSSFKVRNIKNIKKYFINYYSFYTILK
jgi:hypothetical protein